MGKTDDILEELKYQRSTQAKLFDKIDALKDDVHDKHIVVLDKIAKVDKCVDSLKTELRIKSGVWGTLGGAIPVGITIVIMAIKGFFTNNK